MKASKNILPAIAVAVAAMTVLPACKAVPKESSAPEAAPVTAEASNEKGYTWFAKKGQRRAERREAAPAPAAENNAALQRVVVTGYCSCPECCGANASGLTASGTKAQRGTIAADPSIFPFGTQLNVPGYGEGTVEDTGAKVRATTSTCGSRHTQKPRHGVPARCSWRCRPLPDQVKWS